MSSEGTRPPSSLSLWLPPLLLTMLGLATAPALGLVRNWLLSTFPRSFILVLGGSLGFVFLALLGFGIWRIRDRRALRYGALATVAVLVALQTLVFNRGNPQVDVVEKVHFLQFGLLSFLFYRARRTAEDASMLWVPLIGVLLAGTLEEWVQWLVPSRTGEIKDVLLNFYAGICGLLLSLALAPPHGLKLRQGFQGLGRAAAVALVGVAGFFHLAHLGYVIEDPDLGSFRSWHQKGELLRASAARAERWKERVPRLKHWFGLEDRFATEAGWHVSHRNASNTAGLHFFAWRENQMLERYYGPFLDLPPESETRGPHRLGVEQKKALAAAVPASAKDQPYFSPVLEGRIVTSPSKGLFWFLIALGTAGLWVSGAVMNRRKLRASGELPGRKT